MDEQKMIAAHLAAGLIAAGKFEYTPEDAVNYYYACLLELRKREEQAVRQK